MCTVRISAVGGDHHDNDTLFYIAVTISAWLFGASPDDGAAYKTSSLRVKINRGRYFFRLESEVNETIFGGLNVIRAISHFKHRTMCNDTYTVSTFQIPVLS